MNVTADVRSTAIFQVFHRYDIRYPGRLSLTDLLDGWKEVGLRMSDLELGLNELCEAGCVVLENTSEGPCATLTDQGVQYANRRRRPTELVEELSTRATLARARRRRRGIKDPRELRRAEDRSGKQRVAA